jgi:hypothetical protein
MSTEKREKFDKMLSQVLKRHSETVPANFADRILRQIREAEERKILAGVVMEERLVLAGCIVLGIMAVVAVVAFPGVAASLKDLAGTSVDKISRTIGVVRYNWQLYMVFAGVFGFVIYSLVDLLAGDS